MAENTKNTKTEIGTIGQEYENRKTHKRGVLISRNEKYKTLQMEGEDKKTFDVVYSTFKSDWRKYQGADAKTVVKSDEKKADTKPAKEKSEKSEKRGRKSVDAETKVKILFDAKKVVDDAVKAAELNLKSKTLSKGGLAVKFNRSTVFEIWPKFNGKYELVVGEIKLPKCEFVKREETWKNKNVFRTEALNDAVTEIIKQIKPEIEAKVKEAEKEKTKNTKKEG